MESFNFYDDPSFLDNSLSSYMLSLLNENRKLCMMSDFENCFLFSLLKKFSPKKILEIGIAAGGTTYMLCSYIKEHLPNTKLYSVEYSKEYYIDKTKNSGFVSSKYFSEYTNWKLFLGGCYPKFCDEIGKDIDFLILDTAYRLPGELLDFIAVLPFLKDGAVVILHDLDLTSTCIKSSNINWYRAYATKLLFDVAQGTKIICKDESRTGGIPNIGAIIVNNDTRAHIRDLFSATSFIWHYMPPEEDLQIYDKIYNRYYPEEFVQYFRDTWILQKKKIESDQKYIISKLKKYETEKNISTRLTSIEHYLYRYPRWLIRILSCFIPKRKNRVHFRNKYSR